MLGRLLLCASLGASFGLQWSEAEQGRLAMQGTVLGTRSCARAYCLAGCRLGPAGRDR